MDDENTKPDSPTIPQKNTGQLDMGIHDTFILGKNRSLRSMLEKSPTNEGDSVLPHTDVTLMIRGIPEHVMVSEEKPVVLGRLDHGTKGLQPDVDLNPYGATMRGVSRVHARLFIQDKHLYIADLGSKNGTFIGGKRLDPDVPYGLSNGAEVLLGSLMFQVMFE
jgi:hypothetical protein